MDIKYNIDSAIIKIISPGIYKVDLSGWAFTSEGEIPEIIVCFMYNNINEYNVKNFERADVSDAYKINTSLKCGFHVSLISTKNLKKLGVIFRDINAKNQIEFIVKLNRNSILQTPLTLIKRSYYLYEEKGASQFARIIFNKIIKYRGRSVIQKPDYGLNGAYSLDINIDEAIANCELKDNFVSRLKTSPMQSKPVRLICFYLPQFHSIPENDLWWGDGFTEWTNVMSAQPQFNGHYQPRIPQDLGYYNLLNSNVQKQQVEMAKLYGIEGFCFYFYWFDGKTLLEKPVENYLNDANLNLSFCLCWANENWTRRWDGLENEILISQNHSPEDDLAFIYHVAKYLKDPRYIRIKERPLLIVYRPSLLPDAKKTAARWRKWCLDNGLGEIFLAYTQSFEIVPPADYGFDAAIEFPPNISSPPNITGYVKPLKSNFACNVFDWRVFIERSRNYKIPDYTLYRGVCPSWDNTPRRKNRSTVFALNSPEGYKEWLHNAINDTAKRFRNDDEKLIFINAWNEWAEGAYLEPDKQYGYAYLEMTRQALENCTENDEVIEPTRSHHRKLYERRKKDLSSYFKLEWSQRFDFLLDYYSFFKILHKKRLAVFYSSDGTPHCDTQNGNTFCIDSRKKIHDLYLDTLSVFSEETIAFVILQYNQFSQTLDCVRKIKNLNDHRIRIVIVDNGSTNENKKAAENAFKNDPQVTLIYNDCNKGFAYGNNVGYRYAKKKLKPKFIIMINNDTIIEDNNFIAHMENLFTDWSYSALGPEITTPDGRKENPWNDYIYSIDGWQRLLDLYYKQQENFIKTGTAEFERIGSVSHQKKYILNPILQGAAIILSPLFIFNNDYVFEEINFLYGEEHPFAVRALIKGELLLYSSEIKILHNEGVTTGTLKTEQKMLMGYEGAFKSIKKSIEMLQGNINSFMSDRQILVQRNTILEYDNNNKKILFDLFFCQPGFHGGGEYGKAVFVELLNMVSHYNDIELWAVANPDLHLDQWIWERCTENKIKVIPVKNYDEIKAVINEDFFEIFFAPALVVYADGYEYMKQVGSKLNITAKKTKIIGVIHDIRDFELALSYERILNHRKNLNCVPEIQMNEKQINSIIKKKKNEASALKDMYKGICTSTQVDTIVTVSNYTKNTIIKKIVNCEHKLKVFYSPMKHRPAPERFCFDNIDFNTMNYMLFVNASRLEKNAAAFVRAFDKLSLKEQQLPNDLYVVLTGVEKFSDIGVKSNTIENYNKFILLPFLKPEHLEYLYQNASYLTYTSLYEGFGYPPLEAIYYGKPCLVSKVSAIPEVCSDAAVYCDPYDVNSIAGAIKNLILNKTQPEIIKQKSSFIYKKQRSDLQELVNFLIDAL